MNESLLNLAKKIISENIHITIATSTKSGVPWNTPIFAAYDETYNFYWCSSQDSQHSKNMSENNNVFIVIFDSRGREGQGVYIQAKAFEITDKIELGKALSLYYKRKGEETKPINDFLQESPRRLYKAVPENVWINTFEEADGYIKDSRVTVDLFI